MQGMKEISTNLPQNLEWDGCPLSNKIPCPSAVLQSVSAQQTPPLVHSWSVPEGQGWRASQFELASPQLDPQKLVIATALCGEARARTAAAAEATRAFCRSIRHRRLLFVVGGVGWWSGAGGAGWRVDGGEGELSAPPRLRLGGRSSAAAIVIVLDACGGWAREL